MKTHDKKAIVLSSASSISNPTAQLQSKVRVETSSFFTHVVMYHICLTIVKQNFIRSRFRQEFCRISVPYQDENVPSTVRSSASYRISARALATFRSVSFPSKLT